MSTAGSTPEALIEQSAPRAPGQATSTRRSLAKLPTWYYVQRAQSHNTYSEPQGWQTVIVKFDRDAAEAYA
jgi:hypothetical protein